MILDRITLGSTPHAEECAQVGESDYEVLGRAECRIYANQLKRVLARFLGERELPSKDFRLIVKGHAHDFGMYYEVDCQYSVDNELACQAAMYLESHGPSNWDAEAIKELSTVGLDRQPS